MSHALFQKNLHLDQEIHWLPILETICTTSQSTQKGCYMAIILYWWFGTPLWAASWCKDFLGFFLQHQYHSHIFFSSSTEPVTQIFCITVYFLRNFQPHFFPWYILFKNVPNDHISEACWHHLRLTCSKRQQASKQASKHKQALQLLSYQQKMVTVSVNKPTHSDLRVSYGRGKLQVLSARQTLSHA